MYNNIIVKFVIHRNKIQKIPVRCSNRIIKDFILFLKFLFGRLFIEYQSHQIQVCDNALNYSFICKH